MATEKKPGKKKISNKESIANREEAVLHKTEIVPTSGSGTLPAPEKERSTKQRKESAEIAGAPAEKKPKAGEKSDLKKTKSSAAAKAKVDVGLRSGKEGDAMIAKETKPSKAGKLKARKINLVTKKTIATKPQSFNETVIVPALKKIIFQLRYHTVSGENIFVTGNYSLLGNNNTESAFPLQYLNENYWFGELEIPQDQILKTPFLYRYFVKNNNNDVIQSELLPDKYFTPPTNAFKEIRLIDTWSIAGNYQNTFLTEPFKNVLLRQNETLSQYVPADKYTHIFKVKAPLLAKNEVVALYGNAASLGNWGVARPALMHKQPEDDWWILNIDLAEASFPLSYKYGVFNIEANQFVQMEGDRNRFVLEGAEKGKLTILTDGFADFNNTVFKGAGVAIPVFSLRTENSFGVGEFNDIMLLVDWARLAGLKVIQILPVNDTIATHTWVDSYPYAAISAFALHPIFLHLPQVVSEGNKQLLQGIEAIRLELNSLDKVDYEQVVNTKLTFLRKVYPLEKISIFKSEAFNAFFAENDHWLVPYAAFCFFRDEYGTPDFTSWPDHNKYHEETISQFASTPLQVSDEIGIHFFIQYHLHLQLKQASSYAHQNGIIVKGDIPIGIYRNSADAWQEPELYDMEMQAGAPPDDFAVKGQNWGFPTYNWQRMQQDGFTWWKRRFAQMRYYFDAFRIDHILGFFRIWSIPLHAVEGIMGRFVPAIPIHKSELEYHGFTDIKRLTSPFINEDLVWQFFGELTPIVKAEFLNETGLEHFVLKPAFDTQRKIKKHFENLPSSDESHTLKYGLYNLISNVILFEADNASAQEFHFRIAMENTPSFRYIDEPLKGKLRELYINYFFRRQDAFWRGQAMQKLPELKRSTNMLICGEDLGMVPDCVPGVMRDLGILSLEIQRMPKDPSREFFHPADAPYLSVVTPSTHDMSTIRGWWEEDRAKTWRFYNYQLGKWGDAPFFCEPEVVKDILIQHFYSPAMWSIFQLQDLLGMDGALRRNNPADERINLPANPQNYWQYRMHLTIEELIKQTDFNNALHEMIQASGRL